MDGGTSDVAISATLNQGRKPIAFMSQSLQGNDLRYSALEKDATAIIENEAIFGTATFHFHSKLMICSFYAWQSEKNQDQE